MNSFLIFGPWVRAQRLSRAASILTFSSGSIRALRRLYFFEFSQKCSLMKPTWARAWVRTRPNPGQGQARTRPDPGQGQARPGPDPGQGQARTGPDRASDKQERTNPRALYNRAKSAENNFGPISPFLAICTFIRPRDPFILSFQYEISGIPRTTVKYCGGMQNGGPCQHGGPRAPCIAQGASKITSKLMKKCCPQGPPGTNKLLNMNGKSMQNRCALL